MQGKSKMKESVDGAVEGGKANWKCGLIDFKIESNQINLLATLVMEKYAKFQLGKNKLGKIDAALQRALSASSISLCLPGSHLTVPQYPSTQLPVPSALINLNFHRQMAGKSFQLLFLTNCFPLASIFPSFF